MRKYRIIEDSNANGKAFRPQFKFFLFWHNFSEFKGLYTEIYIYDTLEEAKKRIDEDICDRKREKELKASYKRTIISYGSEV